MKPAITHLVSEILTHNIIMEPKKQPTAGKTHANKSHTLN
jgi:hypothetical protein